MNKVVLDSYALLALYRGESGKDEVAKLLTAAADGAPQMFVTVINIGEVYYISSRKDGKEKAEDVLLATLSFPMEFVEADWELTMDAARLKAKYKMSYADAFAAALSKKKKAVLITGDYEFKSLEKEIKIKFLK